MTRSVEGERNRISISVPLSLGLARKLGYYRTKPKRTPQAKAEDWCKRWSERLQKYQQPQDLDGLCFSQLILETMAGVDNPQTKLAERRSQAAGRPRVVGRNRASG